MSALEPIARPNGKLYRPRKVVCHAIVDEDDFTTGVVVLGTHDVERARPLADRCVRMWVDSGYTAEKPVAVWWRDGMEMGQRQWVSDEIRGRAGVSFVAAETDP